MTEFLTIISDYLPLSPLATHIGITCLFSQVTLTLLFNKRTGVVPSGPWTYLPAFTAHQLVALPLMIILSYVGWRDWFFSPNGYDEGATASDRIFGYSNPNDISLAIGSGAILLWDTPTGLLSPPLRDPLMLAHHVGMFLVAATMSGTFCSGGNMIGYYYVPFYFGVIELSGIPLTYVDLFHPRYEHYNKWLNAKHSNKKTAAFQKMLKDVNDVAQKVFALTFLALRGIYFPYVSFSKAIPDLMKAFENPPNGVPMWTGYFLVGMISLFALLQAYWGLIIAKKVKKALCGSSGDKDKQKST